jgi:SAM-dependent methyltransferase
VAKLTPVNAVQALRAKLRELRWRMAGHYTRPLGSDFTAPLAGGRALEVGGPSRVFSAAGLMPVYPLLDAIDGVQWAAETAWHSLDRAAGYSPEGARRGELLLTDDIDLAQVPEDSYDAVLSSHVLEHIANPLRALSAWRRVTRPGGHLLMIVPHKQGTFDHRRATTPLAHVIEDFRRGVSEDDLTHLQETIALHDRSRDAEADEGWVQRRESNASTRLLHHHTFTTPSLLALLDHAGLELRAVETRHPHDIYVLARWPSDGERPDNLGLLKEVRRSPFRGDREAVAQSLTTRGSSAT